MPEFDVVSLPETDHVEVGDTAPDFTRPLVTREYWEDASLADLLDDGPVLLVFYPMNWGGKARYTWKEIEARGWGDGVRVVGVNVATPFDHKVFMEDRDMDPRYALFADPGNGVAEAYGVAHDLDGMSGVSEPRPAAFLVDEDRTIEYAWVAEEWPEQPPYDEVEAELKRVANRRS